MRVAVVGAGIMGASAALALTDRGHAVTLFDQFPVGHDRGSSHGRSRIVRAAYPDPFFTEIMVVGYPMWRELQSRVGPSLPNTLLHEVGLILFGRPKSAMVADTIRSLNDLGVPHEIVQGDIAQRQWGIEIRPEEVAVLTPGAGWVHAANAVAGTIDLARQQGAIFIQKAADPRALVGQFDRVIACVGAWAPAMFDVDATVTCQTVAYVDLGRSWRGPVYIEDSPDFVYGFPSERECTTVKVGVHTPGPPIDPRSESRPRNEAMIERILRFARERFGAENPKIDEVVTCLYTNTADEDFRWGEEDGVIWASPCSGHGFKFGPWIGARLADFAEGKRSPEEWPRFHRR